MATHRRGLRPSQWPVRDLLGPDGGRGRLWDARIGAAVTGLLACGAAVTVVLTSDDPAASDSPVATGPLEWPAPGPSAPPPAPVVPPPGPAAPGPAAPGPAAPGVPAAPVPAPAPVPLPGLGAVPPVSHAPARVVPAVPPRGAPPRPVRPAVHPGPAPVAAPSRPAEPTLAEQVATGIEQWQRRSSDRPVAAWVLVPVQRPADAAALLELACGGCSRESGGRHRAPDHDDEDRSGDDRGEWVGSTEGGSAATVPRDTEASDGAGSGRHREPRGAHTDHAEPDEHVAPDRAVRAHDADDEADGDETAGHEVAGDQVAGDEAVSGEAARGEAGGDVDASDEDRRPDADEPDAGPRDGDGGDEGKYPVRSEAA